jgi:hypothetical protein
MPWAEQPIRLILAVSITLWTSLWCCCATKAHASAGDDLIPNVQVDRPPSGCASGGCGNSHSPPADGSQNSQDASEDCGCGGDVDRAKNTPEALSVSNAPVASVLPLAYLPVDVDIARLIHHPQDHFPLLVPSSSLLSLHCLLTT